MCVVRPPSFLYDDDINCAFISAENGNKGREEPQKDL